MKLIYIFICWHLLLTISFAQAAILSLDFKSVDSEENIRVHSSSIPMYKSTKNVSIQTSTEIIQQQSINTSSKAEIKGKVLNYPNPFTLENGTSIGYYLSKNLEITLYIYDMRGSQIFKQTYPAGSNQGKGGSHYNTIFIDKNSFNNDLAVGVYFYVLAHEKDVLGKGKMVVKQ